MNQQVYDNFIGLLDDALALVKEAMAVAEARPAAPTPEVHLTKVASSVYEKTASALMGTGVFDNMTQGEMKLTLEEAGESGHLAILEKLASRAAFPLNIRMDGGGELVERQTTSSGIVPGMSTKTALWREALDEARRENG